MRFSAAIAALFIPAWAVTALEGEFECLHAQAVTLAAESQETYVRYGRDRAFDVKHIKLQVELDFEKESIFGVATHTVSPIGNPASEIAFDAVNLDIDSVTGHDGSPFDFEVTNDKLRVYFANPIAVGTSTELNINYSTTRPTAGIHFRTDRLGYTKAETQAWTQGEPEDARHWFPCLDYPNERATTEVICTVRDDFVALSNGSLIGTTHDAANGKKTFHWRQRQEHVTYLVSLVAGPYISIQDHAGGIPLFYYVLPGQESDARKTYRNTPAMFDIFQERIGVPYPYERYSQVSVIDFMYGGMENSSITTMTERIILDDSARLTRSMDDLIAHELAHQWFGDLMTCRDWSHIWLNEGFATYFELIYQEHQFGRDFMIHDLLWYQQDVIDSDRGEGKRPIVSRQYDKPMDNFGYRAYSKGGCVLHMLRDELGDELFWKAVNVYTTRHQNTVVETNDLMRAAEDVSGKSLERFFDQWLYSTGYPELSIDYNWNNDQKLAEVVVKQTQKVTDSTPLFEFTTTIAFYGEDFVHVEPVAISDEVHSFFVPLDERPEFVRFDPESFILKSLKFDKPKPMLIAQLEDDPSIVGRYQACEQLSGKKGDDVVDVLANALKSDVFWGVRAKAAEALGKVEDDRAIDALLENADAAESRVRLAVINELASSDERRARAELANRIETDPASYIVAAAINGLAKQQDLSAIPVITAALERDSHSEGIRSAALRALAKLRAEENLDLILPYTNSSAPRMSRRAAITAVGTVGELMEDQTPAREALIEQLSDPHPSRRRSAINALETLGDVRAITALEKLAETTKRDAEAENARNAINKLRTKKEPSSEVKALREEVDTLNDAQKKLKLQLEALEERVKATNDEDDEGNDASE